MNSFSSVDEIIELLAQSRNQDRSVTLGFHERVDALDHALQCAYNVQGVAPQDLELQAAALVHDVGHILEPATEATHGLRGAEAIRAVLGPRVATLVELHVPAKRYLIVKEPTYVTNLSDSSLYTLVGQGGRMTAAECAEFEQEHESHAAITLRRADEAAKVPGRVVPDLASWHDVLVAVSFAQALR